jgi:hypothetical protein
LKSKTVDREVFQHEPHTALFGGESGDDYYYSVYRTARQWETPAVVMEVGDIAQARRIQELFQHETIYKANVWRDSAGKGRVVVAVSSEEWEFLLDQPDYSISFDIPVQFPGWYRKSSIPKPGSLLAEFMRLPLFPRYISRVGATFQGLLPRFKRPRIKLRFHLRRRTIGAIRRKAKEKEREVLENRRESRELQQ